MKATGRKAGAQTTFYMTRISERHRSNANYADLPLRDHEQIAATASRIEHGVDADEREELQTNSGINGEGTYKTGQTLGSSKAKHQDAFVIPKGVWATIAKEISKSNHTTPAQTAPRVGNITKKSFWTAETYSYFLMFLGPVVLKGRLPAPYYAHFILFSEIAKRMTSQEISYQELPVLHSKIVVWVKAFEK
ncbi:hypothetical protein QFC22_006753 [Naganishia vaughanmartiniae]|uniref:Uncharacterized protein n=1 Tax=Naganishia vaughanmartiniae TaxID=1424756 RepID=A0ACC2WGN7_9TREE|nr:hypothetical protein QFC22_006753 [Naganishia vaughanmartiniae]